MVTLKDVFEQIVKGRLEDNEQTQPGYSAGPARAAQPARTSYAGEDSKSAPLLGQRGSLRRAGE